MDSKQLLAIANGDIDVDTLSDTTLVSLCELAEQHYRQGRPLVSDDVFDHVLLPALQQRVPNHSLLHVIGDEGAGFGERLPLPEPMLSTEKSYDHAGISRWVARMHKAAETIGLATPLPCIVNAKLDGFAGYDDGTCLITRGNGLRGNNISHIFERGVAVYGDGRRGQGPGELVVRQSYFERQLAEHFVHPRNFQASLIKEKALDRYAEQAVIDQAVFFVPFAQLPSWTGTTDTLLAELETIAKRLRDETDFATDGVVISITDVSVKQAVGATRHHHRWQIAYKQNTDGAEVIVRAVTPQTGRTGRVTPVAELTPRRLSGAVIRRATAHHYGLVRDQRIGANAIVHLVRSGEVIPKITAVTRPGDVVIPTHCPSCETPLQWDDSGDVLLCVNHNNCPAQLCGRMVHFFHTLGNADGFGDAHIQKLFACGVRTVADIYALHKDDFINAGFGDKQSDNMIAALARTRQEAIEDWRFLSAFGIERLGEGNAAKLLHHFSLEALFTPDVVTIDAIVAIDGFANKTATIVRAGLDANIPLWSALEQLRFQLIISERSNASLSPRALDGKRVCFTGTMRSGDRNAMAALARQHGATVVTSVGGNTDYLVVGNDPGSSKRKQAVAKEVSIINEDDFLSLIGHST